ncbi:MAG: hypothetical protein ACT4QC_21430 [Planctomycetaceae bacterium]
MFERYAAGALVCGAALMLAAYVWLLLRAFRQRTAWGLAGLFPPALALFSVKHFDKARRPLTWLAAGAVIIGATFALNHFFARHLSLGAREKLVDGELHITLTGWDQHDYSVLRSRPEAVVLQMANPDVTDETLLQLAGLNHLRELDLNDTRVTDAGLETLAQLPALEILRLRGTAVTDEGFRQFLRDKVTLFELDARGTQVASQTLREWKTENKERRKYLR